MTQKDFSRMLNKKEGIFMNDEKLVKIIELLFTASLESLMEKCINFPESSFQHVPETFWDVLNTTVNE